MTTPLTNDEENFWRLVRILYNDVPSKLRNFFKSKFQQQFNLTWCDNPTFGQLFLANANTGRTGQHIINVIQQGDSQQFDCTALFYCLLFSGTLQTVLPRPRRVSARTPPITDSECIDELREMRNGSFLLVHSV